MTPIYDPVEFIGKVELLTIAIVGSFITMKFLNAVYENLYEPTMDTIIDSEKSDQYYFKMGKYYIQPSMIIKELIKWIVLLIILMLIYNLFICKHFSKKK